MSIADDMMKEHIENLVTAYLQAHPGQGRMAAVASVMNAIEAEQQRKRDLDVIARYHPDPVKHIDAVDTYRRRMSR